ncbi:MAG TPA: DEAD/DEAH box helicase [Solirubrobacteraceae bacterium]|nr:DEAD/DEAH box helicase [Solirubrobacteraceae bacterium]
MPLSGFSPRVREWFSAAFAEPTPAQAQAWPAIAAGEHVLLSAPTGSGKTLAAFLWALDRLGSEPLPHDAPRHTRLVYVSPLKALSYDVERNLRAPLRGIGADLRVGIRTGDTPQRERAAMARNPPDILITTPESLYLILISSSRLMLQGVQAVIVDEIHAVASTKRGAHLALTLERLEEQAAAGAIDRYLSGSAPPLQRIGLSATQHPLEEVGRFLVGPHRSVRIIDTGIRKPLDLKIHVPVESMVEPEQGLVARDPLQPVAGGEATRNSIWPAIYPELLELVRAHRSTIVFVNNRRSAERLALRLNDLAAAADEAAGRPPRELARAHHGSLAREERSVVEELLKAGELPCLVATSSLELGIDMGAVDLVLQVESPKSVARGLQRIGRAGHGVGETSKGRIFPKFRSDLLECAVLARMMREGRIEPTVVPRNALDVLSQQIVAIAATAEPDAVAVDDLYALVTRTHSYAELPRPLLENVLDMLDGRYPSRDFGELRPRIVWDRVAGTIRARKGARALAVANAGTIPDRGLYSVTLPDGRRVGELDEEMVYETRPGQTFLLGASAWRIEEIGRDRVIVTPAPGAPGAVPFWKGDSVGRPKELGRAIGEFSRWAVEQSSATLQLEYDLDERAASNLLAYLAEQQAATRVLPSDRTIVVERFRDEIGDWRLCVLSPYGGRIHAAWGLALSARIRERFGLESDAIWSDDGIIIHLPDVNEVGEMNDDPIVLLSGAELVLIEPDEAEDAIVAELGASALFGARFRENAGRALLIPRAYPGRRTPLWQQRLKSQTLLEVAKRYSDFPIVLETYRECLRDVLDVPGLVELLRGLHSRELSLVEVETPTASPFASSLLFDYVATYMYEGDAPNAERRAAALSLDRDLLRELLGQEELRDLIDSGAQEQVQADLQHCSPRTQATSRDELHDVLRRLGDLTRVELAARVLEGLDAAALVAGLEQDRRAVRVRLAGEERLIASDEAGLYRDALGVVPPGGLPAAYLEDVPDALRTLVARYARTHVPFTTAEANARYGIDLSSVLRELERAGELVRGELRASAVSSHGEREWCDVEVLRRLRRASLAVLRKEIEPTEQRALASFQPSWQGIDRHPPAGAGIDRLREALVPLQGLALPVELWERDVLPRRVGAYSPTWLDSLCAAGELVWVGAGSAGRSSGRVAIYFREDAPLLGPPGRGQPAVEGTDAHELLRARLAASPCFFSDLLAELQLAPEVLQDALWDLVWAGEVTNDAWAPLRSPRLTLARAAAQRGGGGLGRAGGGRRFGPTLRAGGRGRGMAHPPGRWSLAAALFGSAEVGAAERRRALAELLLERHGIVTREQVLAAGVAGGFSLLYDSFAQLETLGVCRRGYFIEGLGGAQFALPGAVERLRAQRTDAPVDDDERERATVVLAAADPAQPYGAALSWPRREGQARRLARVAGAYVVLVAGEPVLYLERGGRGLLTLIDDLAAPDGAQRLRAALAALAAAVQARRVGKLGLERLDGDSIVGSALEPLLIELGFRPGPRKLTLSA